jgi:hypothetical protein
LAIFKRDFLRLVLYKPAEIVKQIEEIEETHGNSTKGDAIASIEFPTHIVGQMTIGSHRRGTSEVLGSAAEQGYGPMLYDISLSIIYPNFLISDRRSVSKSAKKVWDYYHSKRPDVNVVFMSGAWADSSNSTDYKYQIKKPKSFVSLSNNHLKFVSTVEKKYGLKKSKIESSLSAAADYYFRDSFSR